MSQVKLDMIWQYDKVLPYILGELKEKVDAITPISKIYLYGSRARVPYQDWGKLKGKDWDILMICNFPIINTSIWTLDKNYHIDLHVITSDKLIHFQGNYKHIELYPINQLEKIKSK